MSGGAAAVSQGNTSHGAVWGSGWERMLGGFWVTRGLCTWAPVTNTLPCHLRDLLRWQSMAQRGGARPPAVYTTWPPKIRHLGEWRGSTCGPATVKPEKHHFSKKSHRRQMCPNRARAGQKEWSQCHRIPAAERLVCVDFRGLWEGEHQKPLKFPQERRRWGPLTWRQPSTYTVVILTVASDRSHMPRGNPAQARQLPSCNDWAHTLQEKPPHWEACT